MSLSLCWRPLLCAHFPFLVFWSSSRSDPVNTVQLLVHPVGVCGEMNMELTASSACQSSVCALGLPLGLELESFYCAFAG